MDTYQSYRYAKDRPSEPLAAFGVRFGRWPETVIAHPTELAALRAVLPAGIVVDTLPHGGPHPGEVWLQ
jgi:hypothetical protein